MEKRIRRSGASGVRGRASLTLLVAMVSTGCAHSAETRRPEAHGIADFNGLWHVPWCDTRAPEMDCGGFSTYLIQRSDRLCGSYTGVRPRFTQIDEGGPIRGVVVGNTAVLTIESGRSGAIYLVRADLHGDKLHWQGVDTVRPADHDIDIIAGKEVLARESPEPSEWASGIIDGCNIEFDKAGLAPK